MGSTDPKERFYRQFQNSVANIRDQITQLSSFATVGGERQDAVEHILSSISRLSNQVADAADFVPAYDQRTYSDVVKGLRDQVNEATAKFTPKNRFQFKKRAAANGSETAKPDSRRLDVTANASTADSSKPSPETKDNAGSLPTPASSSDNKNDSTEVTRPTISGSGNTTTDIRKPSFSGARDITLARHMRVHITLPASASRATSTGTLTNLDRCVVDMSAPTTTGTQNAAPFASLTLKDIAGSAIVAGHVDGPVHVTGLRDCVVVVAARQVRIHECDNVVFYLHCVSRPIIEGCRGVMFGKVPEGFLTDKEKAETNMYDQVDDFKWLKSTLSPNWSVLPESEAVPVDVWRKALVGNPNTVIEDTLRSLGVGKPFIPPKVPVCNACGAAKVN